VQVLDCACGLAEKQGCFGLAEGLLRILVEEQVPMFGVFQHHVHAPVLAQRVPQRDRVRVAQRGVQADFPLHQPQLRVRRHIREVDLRGGSATTFTA
jgi:hypothetical protein